MNACVTLIWKDVELEVGEPNENLSEPDQIAYAHGVLSAQKGRGKNPYTCGVSLHTYFDIGYKEGKKVKEHLHKKIRAQQKKQFKFRDKNHGYFV